MSKRIALIIAHEGYYENELYIPMEVFCHRNHEVFVASTQSGLAKGSFGGYHQPNGVLSDIDLLDFDAVALIGGVGTIQHFWNNPELHSLLQKAADAGKIIGAICASAATLAKAGILKGGRGTVYPDYAAELTKEGVEFVDEPIVVWGNVVMGRDPASSKAYGERLCAMLEQEG